MNNITKTVIRNLLFMFILACVGVALYLLGAESEVILGAMAMTGIAIKIDDYHIRRSRRTA